MDREEKVGYRIGSAVADALENAYDRGFDRGREYVHHQTHTATASLNVVSLDTFQIVAELRKAQSMHFNVQVAQMVGEAMGKMLVVFDDYIAMPDFDFKFAKQITQQIREIAARSKTMPGGENCVKLLREYMLVMIDQRKRKLDPEIVQYARRVANFFK